MSRRSYKKELEEANAKLEHLQGFKDAVEAANNSQEKFQKEQLVFQEKIIRIEKIHYVVAICIAFLTGIQAYLFIKQNDLVKSQNEKIESQNGLVAIQNDRINIQNNLMEAERRSNLMFLMSNILDKVDEEIVEQRKIKYPFPRRIEYKLSTPLLGRIIALSRAFRPYKILEGNKLVNNEISPERGQLLIALMESELDSVSQNTIVSKGDFSNAWVYNYKFPESVNLSAAKLTGANLSQTYFYWADLSWANLSGANLSGAGLRQANLSEANLHEADLSDAYLNGADLTRSNLSKANLSGVQLHRADLREADLSNADLRGADLKGADLRGADLGGLWITNYRALLWAKCLVDTKNLYPEDQAKLEAEKPCLFTKEGCPD